MTSPERADKLPMSPMMGFVVCMTFGAFGLIVLAQRASVDVEASTSLTMLAGGLGAGAGAVLWGIVLMASKMSARA